MKKHKRTIKEDLRIIKRAVKLIETNTPHFLLHNYLYSFFSTAIFVIANYITASIVDELTGNRDPKKIIFLLSMYAAEIILKIFQDYSWRKIRTFHIVANKWEEVLLNNKSFSMDYPNMEDPLIRAKRQLIIDSRGTGGLGTFMENLIPLFYAVNRLVMCSAISMELFFRHSGKTLSGFEKFIDTQGFSVAF